LPVKFEEGPSDHVETILPFLDEEALDDERIFGDGDDIMWVAFPVVFPDPDQIAAGDLRKIDPELWRVPIWHDGGPAFADLKFDNGKFSSLAFGGKWIDILTDQIRLIVAEAAADPSEVRIRFVEIPHIQVMALWIIRGEEDEFLNLNLITDQIEIFSHQQFIDAVAKTDKIFSESRAASRAQAIAAGLDPNLLGG
jgi:hypothetical protein